jgi:excisionase family DNA binding protein
MKDAILTKKQLADYLKVTERTIDRLREEGLPCFNVGKVIRFDRDEVLKWLKENGKN